MRIQELILRLQNIQDVHGPDVMVGKYDSPSALSFSCITAVVIDKPYYNPPRFMDKTVCVTLLGTDN